MSQSDGGQLREQLCSILFDDDIPILNERDSARIDEVIALISQTVSSVINRKSGLVVTPDQMEAFEMLRAEERATAQRLLGREV